MKKYRLEDLKKDRVFTGPPKGYFDRLPGIIQAKTAHKSTSSSIKVFWIGALKLVPAAALIVLIALYSGLFNGQDAGTGFDEILSEVSATDMILYLEELDISNEEILGEVDLNALSMEFEDLPDPLIDNLEIDDDALLHLYDEFDVQDSLL